MDILRVDMLFTGLYMGRDLFAIAYHSNLTMCVIFAVVHQKIFIEKMIPSGFSGI